MYKKFALRTTTTLIAATIAATSAHAFEFGKLIRSSVHITKQSTTQTHSPDGKKQIYLMSIKLSPKEHKTLLSYQPKAVPAPHMNLPDKVDLGMNGVPVLDQGAHGTCVTFAVTAAIDAVLGEGDHISQLCSLELGKYLEKKGTYLSGWEGAFSPWVLDQLLRFGVISKEDQKAKSCAGVTEYPLLEENNQGNPMSLGEYSSKMTHGLWGALYPLQHMNFFQRFDAHFVDTDNAREVLLHVKKALAKGNRLVMGTLLVISPYCDAGACANYHSKNDTWALTKELQTPPYETAGHEMVIIGYDDGAIAVDAEGKKHRGLLTLRNSWGDEVGDNGNFYMTYSYFKKFVGEIIEIQAAAG